MWQKSSNGEAVKPPEVSIDASGVILTRNHHHISATEEAPEHWEYEEWQMTAEQYEVYLAMQAENADLSDALIELADLIFGGE